MREGRKEGRKIKERKEQKERKKKERQKERKKKKGVGEDWFVDRSPVFLVRMRGRLRSPPPPSAKYTQHCIDILWRD